MKAFIRYGAASAAVLTAALLAPIELAPQGVADEANGQYTVVGPEVTAKGTKQVKTSTAECKPGDQVAGGGPNFTEWYAGKTQDVYELSTFILSNAPSENAKGWIISVMNGSAQAYVLCNKAAKDEANSQYVVKGYIGTSVGKRVQGSKVHCKPGDQVAGGGPVVTAWSAGKIQGNVNLGTFILDNAPTENGKGWNVVVMNGSMWPAVLCNKAAK